MFESFVIMLKEGIEAALVVSIDVGDKMNREPLAFGSNIHPEPVAASVPVRVGGYDVPSTARPAYLEEGDPGVLERVFRKNNILGVVARLWTRDRAGARELAPPGVRRETSARREGLRDLSRTSPGGKTIIVATHHRVLGDPAQRTNTLNHGRIAEDTFGGDRCTQGIASGGGTPVETPFRPPCADPAYRRSPAWGRPAAPGSLIPPRRTCPLPWPHCGRATSSSL